MQLLQKSTYSQIHDIDASPAKHLEASTEEYLHTSFLLWEYKQAYSKKEYRELLQEYCWDKGSTEEKRALKLAEHYQDFSYRPQALTQIPVTTLLRLCSDKYKSIIEELKQFDDEDITCNCVFNLIKHKQAQLKKEKESQLPEKPSIWKRNCRGERYAQYPPIYEEDHQTGILTQKLMDEYDLIPQDILRQAIADFYEKITKGEHEGSAAENVDEWRENSSEDNYSEPVVTVNQTIAETFAYYTTVEELEEDEYLEEPEDSDIELTQNLLDKAIDTLIQGNWESIRDLFNQHPEIKQQAWNALSSVQKRRVIDITPETVKVLNQAKKEGVIEEYKEIAVGVYQIKRPGTILWEQRAFHEIEIRHLLRGWREAMRSEILERG